VVVARNTSPVVARLNTVDFFPHRLKFLNRPLRVRTKGMLTFPRNPIFSVIVDFHTFQGPWAKDSAIACTLIEELFGASLG